VQRRERKMLELAKGIHFPSKSEFCCTPEIKKSEYIKAKEIFDSECENITNGYKIIIQNQKDTGYKYYFEINVDASLLWNLFWDIGDTLFDELNNIYCIYGFKDSEDFELGDYKDKKYIKSVLQKYEYSIVNDGFLSLGIAFDKGIVEEVLIDSFKFLRVFTSQKEKLLSVLEKYNLSEKTDIRFIDEFAVVSETVANQENNVLHPEDIINELNEVFKEKS